MNYLQGGDSFQQVKQGEHAIQTLRTDQSFILLWADLNLKLKTLDIPPRVFLYHADAHHHPMGDHLSSSKDWLLIPPFAPTDWYWFEPWGKTLKENNPWSILADPDPPAITIANGILTLDFTGTVHSGITCNLVTGATPLQNFLGKPLHIVTFNRYADAGTPLDRVVNMAGAFKAGTAILLYLIVKRPISGWGSADYGFEWSPPVHTAWLYIGTGLHDINLLDFFQRAAVDLGIDPDPEGWYISWLEIAHRDIWPYPSSQINNDFLGLFYPVHPGDSPPPPGTGWQGPNRLYRVRFPMIPYPMIPSEYYALLLRCDAYYASQAPEWQYDKGDATYPYGIRIFSPDGGYTWNDYFNDDHIFALFGTPPAPTPPPEPPIDHWTILDIQQIRTSTGYIIIATTNVPCHLYMFWTNIEPEKHPRTRISRGLTVPDATDYCFVVWHENEQEEPGDTIYHTFIKEPWPVCETRWFTFRALVNNEWSPSVGPIFKKHRAVLPPFIEPYTIIELLPSLVFTDQYTIEPNPPDYTQVFTDPYTWS